MTIPTTPTEPIVSSSPLPSAPASASASLSVGDVVFHEWERPQDETTVRRYGIVVELVAPTTDEKSGGTVAGGARVAWLDPNVSDKILLDDLELA